MGISEQSNIGVLLKRNNINNISIQNLTCELQVHLFELNVLFKAIENFKSKKLKSFDAVVGDRKCQVRASIIIDLSKNRDFINKDLLQDENDIRKTISFVESKLDELSFYNQEQLKELSRELRKQNLFDYFIANKCNFTVSYNTKLLGLCYFGSLTVEELVFLSNNKISKTKIKNFLNDHVKKQLCKISVDYEQNLAFKENCVEKQMALKQIEVKGFCFMTPVFPSFKLLLQKMKENKQGFIQKIIKFCMCGGKQKIDLKVFKPGEDCFVEDKEDGFFSEEIVKVIEGYQYPGSFEELKKTLNLREELAGIPKDAFQKCMCKNFIEQKNIENIKEALLANAAQHQQFTSGAEIDFEGLGLENSELKREYEYLKTLDGFGIHDMSKFCINHIYPNTIAAEMKLAQESGMKMKQPVARVQKQAQGIQAA